MFLGRSNKRVLSIWCIATVGITLLGFAPDALGWTIEPKRAQKRGKPTFWSWTVKRLKAGETIRDIHICIGTGTEAQRAALEVNTTFTDKPTNWQASVTSDGDGNIYLNFFATVAGTSLLQGDTFVFKAKIEKKDPLTLKKGGGTITYVATNDGNADAGDGKLAETASNRNPRAAAGPILVSASGRCDFGDGLCSLATAGSCALLEGVFDAGSTCTTGACCAVECFEASEYDCENPGFGKYRGDGSTCAEECPEGIPTVSEWGLVALTLVLLTAGTIVLRRRAVAA